MPQSIEDFVLEWQGKPGKETSVFQTFILKLCAALQLPEPGNLAEGGDYCFEASISAVNPETGGLVTFEMDLYRKNCFVMEAKRTSDEIRKGRQEAAPSGAGLFGHNDDQRAKSAYVQAMTKAFGQAVKYAKELAIHDEKPPFLIVCDVGIGFYIWDSFGADGYGRYASHKFISLDNLNRPEVQDYFQAIWTDPHSLNPEAKRANVTREIAEELGSLKMELKKTEGNDKRIANFLMRIVFTFFAESVGLLPKDLFLDGLKKWERSPERFQQGLKHFWEAMNVGGEYGHDDLKRFNGGLFKDTESLKLERKQIRLLKEAAEKSWRDVDPSIFGTLLESALGAKERRQLGAHYTPRAHIQRLINATFGNDLWEKWTKLHDQALALLESQHSDDDAKNVKEKLLEFRRELGRLKILDPACGSGNFLYVAFDTLKRIEEEIIATLLLFGETKLTMHSMGEAITPANFLGIEVNEWAASIAELVLWIAYIQWYLRLYPLSIASVPIPEPVLQNYESIQNRDAVLEWDGTKETGKTRWGGRKIKSGRTGRLVPDPDDQVSILEYINPRPAKWPKADYIVGNPPFLGNKLIREKLGDGYAAALRQSYPNVAETVDFVMYWWHKAALEVRCKRSIRFGLITTNSIRQVRLRGLVAHHLESQEGEAGLSPLKLVWAISDHPWGGTAANVRIAMTVGGLKGKPWLGSAVEDGVGPTPEARADSVVIEGQWVKEINADLSFGTDMDLAASLKSNAQLAINGIKLHGNGFLVSREKYVQWGCPEVVHPYMNGRDLVQHNRGLYVIDLFGMDKTDVRQKYPQIYQHLLETTKPERDQNNRQAYKDNWWIFGEPRANLRPALVGLPRYIVTLVTPKHRFFTFLDGIILPDDALVAIASDDAFHLGVLSSVIHKIWVMARCGHLGKGLRYNKSICFDPFPFPDPPQPVKERIRQLGEELDRHVKNAQARGLTITEIYNLVDLIKSGSPLTPDQCLLHENAVTNVLIELHDELDDAVREAYGWPKGMSTNETLQRLVALNRERAEEEANGNIRYLRPSYQSC